MARPALATVSVLAIVAQLEQLLAARWSSSTTRPGGRCRWACSSSRASTPPTPPGSWPTWSSSMVPALAFYAVAERQLIGGLTSGATKG